MALGDSSGFDLGSSLGNISPLQAGTGALALGGLGYMASQGPGSLPSEFTGLVQGQAPAMNLQGQQAFAQGQQLYGQGTEALRMAQAGVLTPAQQAELNQYATGLNNQSRQMFYSMGRNPDQDTAALTQSANVDAMVNAMAQKEIQSTIALGLGEISGGSSLMGTGLGFENAANQVLLAAGNAQLKNDQQYSTNLMGAFGAIGKLFGGFGGSSAGGAAGGAATSSALGDLGLGGEDASTVLESLALVA